MCGCGYAHAMTCVCGGVCVKGQLAGVSLSPSTMLVPGSDSGCQAWPREPSTSESSHQFIFIFFCFFFLTSLSVCTCVYVSVCASVFVCAGTHIYGECVARIYVYVCVWVQTPACVCASCLFCPHASSFFETVSLIFVKLMFYRLWLASPFPQVSCLRFLVLGLEAYPSTSDFVPGSWRPKLRLSCLSSKVLYPLSHFSNPNKLF